MALTFLGITNKVLSRLNEAALTSGNFSAARGIHKQAQEAVNAAIRDIHHAERQWPFNHTEHTETLVDGTQTYALPADTFIVDWESFFIASSVPLAIDGYWLEHIGYDDWQQNYRAAEQARTPSKGAPLRVFATQNSRFGLSPVPNAAYTLKFEYFTIPADLSAHGDTTTIPDAYENIIVDGAMFYVEMFRENQSAAAGFKSKFDAGIGHMRSILINKETPMLDTRVSV